jgi:hypothetical protein
MSKNKSIPIGPGEPETVAGGAEEAAPAAEVRANTNESEEGPVIDVHAPHGGMHTWKDFWIHLGTIAAGLLIAISLEQSVEALHRLHERHQLEADLQAEGVENQTLAERDWLGMDDRMAATAAQLREVESTLAGRKKMAAPFPAPSFTPPPLTGFALPLSAVWTTAKESASIDLLPREVARSYARLYLQTDRLQQMTWDSDRAGDEVTSYKCRFSDGTLPCKPDLSQMTDEQLGEYSGLLTRYFTLLQEEKARVLIFEAMNDQILHGGAATLAPGTLTKFRAEHPDTFLRPLPGTGAKP